MNKLFTKIAALSVGLALAVGVGVAVDSKGAKVVKAAEEVISFATTNSEITATGTDKTLSVSGLTLTFSNITGISATDVQNAKNATITSSEVPGTIVSVKLYDCATTSAKTDGSFTVYGGTSSESIDTEIEEVTGLSSTASDHEVAFGGNYTFFKVVVGSARVLKHSKIDVAYSSGELEPGIVISPSSLSFDIEDEGTDVTVTPNAAFTSTPTVSVSNVPDCVTASVSGLKVTVSPAEVGSGTLTITATNGDEVASKTLSVEVTADPGSASNPYTVAQALAAATGNGKYATGIISQIDEVNTTYGNATYYISDNGETTSQMKVYRGKYLDNAAFTSADQIAVGDVVVVCGNISSYKNANQFAQNNYLVSLQHSAPETVYSIQDIYSAPVGSPVEIDGYFVGAVSDGFYLMDGEYGIYVYKGSAPEGAVVNETKLHVEGAIGNYYNLIQITGATVTVNASAEVATPINYTLTGSESTSDLSIESRRMVEKGVISKITIDSTDYTPTYEGETPTVDTKKDIFLTVNGVQVIYKKSDVTQSVFNSLFGYLLNGKNVNVESFTSFYNSSFQLRFSSVVEATEGYTAEKFAADLLEKTDAVCEGYDGVTNNKEALAAVWLELQENVLSDEEIGRFNDEENDFDAARARYDYLVGKYGLTDFLGRNPAPIAGGAFGGLEISNNSNNMILIIIAIATTSAIALGALLILKKKKHQ